MKKKWSFRSISFSKKDKNKPAREEAPKNGDVTKEEPLAEVSGESCLIGYFCTLFLRPCTIRARWESQRLPIPLIILSRLLRVGKTRSVSVIQTGTCLLRSTAVCLDSEVTKKKKKGIEPRYIFDCCLEQYFVDSAYTLQWNLAWLADRSIELVSRF